MITINDFNPADYSGGTDSYYKHMLGITYTQGVKDMAHKFNAFWLIDLIASHQLGRIRKTYRFQIWTIEVADRKGLVQASEDTGEPPFIQQKLRFTDFPDTVEGEPFKLYCIDGVILLPTEY